MWRSAVALWGRGASIGLRSFRQEPVLGLKRVLLPVSYWRTAEFAYVLRKLEDVTGESVLDLGSPKELAIILAESHRVSVAATDIMPFAVALSRRYCTSLGIDGRGPGKVHSEVQDGREFSYETAAFDAAFSVSVLEHIPGDGDSKAIRELARVVRPGGRIVVTVPFADVARDTFVDGDVYERRQVERKLVFFQRHYDHTSLRKRLFEPSGCRVEDLELWTEGRFPVESILLKLRRFGLPLAPFQPFLAAANLRRTENTVPPRPMAAFFTLVTPQDEHSFTSAAN
jgi:SAM-dependent methyltransferase